MGEHRERHVERGERGTRRVLCALSDQRQREYQSELAELRRQGIDLFVQPAPDLAIEQIQAMRPRVVLIGTDVGPMEWFEFVALLGRRYRDLDAQVIVVPDKDDPFSPVLQARDPMTGALTGHYISERLHLDDIVSAVCAVTGSADPTVRRTLATGSGPISLSALQAAERKRSSD